jgi:hypothetical protein
MALSTPRTIFGVHSATPYSRTNGLPYGILKVLKGSSLNISGDLVKLTGGSSKYPWQIEEGLLKAEIGLKVSEYPDFLFELFGGKAPTAASTDTTGTVSTLTDKYGTTLVGSTGIASIGITASTGAAQLKFGKYVVKAVSGTTVDVYLLSDIDIARGDDATYQNDALKITASALTITTGGTIVIPNTGLEFTGGAGTIGMTTGDTATFEVKPPSTASMAVTLGATSDTFPEFGMLMVAKKAGDSRMFEVDALRVKGAGIPIQFEENSFSMADIKAEAFYDSTENAVMKIRAISPS